MEEEITNANNYVYQLKWVYDAEKKKQSIFESTSYAEVPILLQVHKAKSGDFHNNFSEELTLSDNHEVNIRWKEICQKIRIDHNLDEEKKQQLQKVLERYQDVFAWNKRELGCYTIGKHSINT